MTFSLRALGGWPWQPQIVVYLHSLVERIRHIDSVIPIYKESCRQLKLPRSTSTLSEVIQQLTFAIKNLNGTPHPIDHVQVSFRIHANAFRPEHRPRGVADFADGVLEGTELVQNLHPE